MASFDRSNVRIALSCIIFEIFNVEEYRDLETLGYGSLPVRIYARSVHRRTLYTQNYLSPLTVCYLQLVLRSESRRKLRSARQCVTVVPGYSRSSKLVPIESPYANSYSSSIATMCLSSIVSEI